ncbi:MAG: single-stranded-DNA-specific exonuclease RecJ [Lachnospiraceae bacterium]|nr:single-stranded-DNA-specific exonuclease RecJ [Lachnospiraceae bacterium]MBQ9927983.1 single-stranded-DNA-specific exonuclease RecJ [Lachnospiraceae bacterium]
MAKWMIAAKKADFNKIAQDYGITPVLARIMRNRDVTSDEDIRKFLQGTPEDLHSPFLLKDIDKATRILQEKIEKKLPIRIIGDYDVDGICSTYILLLGLKKLNACVDRVIPHRIKDGYGLNDSLIEDAYQDGIDTIVTCDNGIAAASQIAMAGEKNMTVVVTDHHEVPYEETENGRCYILPKAAAVVDPKREDCPYPFKGICGAVVALKLVLALHEKSGRSKQETEQILNELLPFAALATVCDVMELMDENRIIVKYGLAGMLKTSNLGLRALLKANGIEEKEITPYHAGFILGPCLNATGRLDTAARALSLFETDKWQEAVTIAEDLKTLNDSRKKMTEDGVAAAVSMVEESNLQKDKVLVVYLPECHESLAGIIAGKVREKFGKPAFVLTKGEEGIKGSGRSIEAYDMYEEMTACKELFSKYGGHKMAAGLSFAGEEEMNLFRKRINESCKLTEEDFEEIVHIDVPMPLSYANRDFIKELSLLEPFGVGNKKPLFAQKNVRLISGRILGKNKNVGKYTIADETGRSYEMIFFGDMEKWHDFLHERFGQPAVDALYQNRNMSEEMYITMAYYPDLNYFAGRESVQIVMQHYC